MGLFLKLKVNSLAKMFDYTRQHNKWKRLLPLIFKKPNKNNISDISLTNQKISEFALRAYNGMDTWVNDNKGMHLLQCRLVVWQTDKLRPIESCLMMMFEFLTNCSAINNRRKIHDASVVPCTCIPIEWAMTFKKLKKETRKQNKRI